MVADQPVFADIAKEVPQRLQGHIFVAHNARFDYGFFETNQGLVSLSEQFGAVYTEAVASVVPTVCQTQSDSSDRAPPDQRRR